MFIVCLNVNIRIKFMQVHKYLKNSSTEDREKKPVNFNDLIKKTRFEENKKKKKNIIIAAATISALAVTGLIITL
jgi:hypothetical protein